MTHPFFERLHSSFSAQSMMSTLGASLTEVQDGTAVIEAPILPGARQQHGFGHAGLTFAIGDSAAGYAALSVMPESFEVLTSEIKINLLAPAKGELLIATGKVIKSGRRLVIVTSEVVARDGDTDTLIAILQGTMVPVPV
ncbi:PaaI family thioesterase [Thalassovita taeanensis]|uniref:Uncharacterized domain 1-containing protein n=1 Tax=Thalassovita taeanensis TaxID=657014 RepID=A0A1H9ABP2_9RHOB|nr:PaaI family thioesterase [Thalassovita taeanensis]SEP74182.1 uncharacterized domain 1-containing protein [Thalassovita taeanensis]